MVSHRSTPTSKDNRGREREGKRERDGESGRGREREGAGERDVEMTPGGRRVPSCLSRSCNPLSLSLPVLHTPTVATVLHTGALGGAVTASEVVEGQLESGKSGRAETA